MVEVDERLSVDAADVFGTSQGHVAGITVRRSDLQVVESVVGVVAPQFLEDNAPFALGALFVERERRQNVAHGQQRGVDKGIVVVLYGQAEPVDGTVESRESVDVAPVFHALRLKELYQSVARKVLRAVEYHVFEKVGGTPLRIGFIDRAHPHDQSALYVVAW